MSEDVAPMRATSGPRRPETRVPQPPQKRAVGIRRVRMTISKIDPLSALKLGFLLSVAFGLMFIIATILVWLVLDGMHVFSSINDLLETLNNAQLLQAGQYLQFGRWVSFSVIVAIVDVVLLTALTALGALIYNLFASLVGGVHITVTDE
ncbi:DUF3566 domain-containing protein [Neoactinobaculum massilliense]|uniref:DUF3566 domain-containing protein n=1 Tax=Neoactinobaculum massilliense TaxID=2364794 RepID=UPI001F155FBA|nr:DUF3566 domain-containing protein [Neoactinobaculum massilliense]